MECRICKQPISFVKGTRPGQKRKVTVAVHANEVSQAVADMQGEVVTPHPGSQRKLRMELEHSHRQGQGAPGEMTKMAADAGRSQAEHPSPQPALPKSEIPGADVINQPNGQPAGQATGEQTDEHHDARRGASY